ncbi:MAG: sodium:proton antiporter NhaD [Bacteroidota bacterium]
MFIIMIVVFVLGYTAIALEHPIRVDKAATALLTGVALWVLFAFGSGELVDFANMAATKWSAFFHYVEDAGMIEKLKMNEDMYGHDVALYFVTHFELLHHLGEIAEILFFLLGAMTIVEIVDQHQGFKVITDKIKTTKKVKLLWILSFLTFFMSAALDNLTTTIVMVALLRKLISDKPTRWFFASMVVLAANAGGAWSPIGDVTTIMLWVKGQVTTLPIIIDVFLPSLMAMVIPLVILTFTQKGTVERPEVESSEAVFSNTKQRVFILILGVSCLLFVPVFKTLTHLPPYMGMLMGLGIMWLTTEIMHRDKIIGGKKHLKVTSVLAKVDVPTVLFFLGILTAVAALQSAGHLEKLAHILDKEIGNIYIINLIIGALSAVVDNVPLVAGAMGMYPIAHSGAVGEMSYMVVDGQFWQMLAYCAGTGGSILIIGSAAGVAAMGMEKIDFIWYMKKISLLALIGYLAGAATYYLMFGL